MEPDLKRFPCYREMYGEVESRSKSKVGDALHAKLAAVLTPLLMTFHRHAGFGWPRSDILDLCDAISGEPDRIGRLQMWRVQTACRPVSRIGRE